MAIPPYFIIFLTLTTPPIASAITATNTSRAFLLLNTTTNTRCVDVPDTPARAFLGSDGQTVLVCGNTAARFSHGPNLLNTTRDCTILFNKTNSPDPALYATDEFIHSTFSFDNGTVVALLHDEFPGMNYNKSDGTPWCNVTTGARWPRCWTVSISLAVSEDWGRTWLRPLPPPANLVAAVPYPYESTRTIFGWGDMGGITPGPDGWFYVAMYNRMTKALQQNGTCVMRTRSLLDPRSWRGWGGSAFTVPFVSAYALQPGEEANHICTVLDPAVFPEPCVIYGTTWSTYLGRFVATVNCNTMARPIHEYDYKIYFTTSTDMIHWEPLQLLLDPRGPPEVPQFGGADMITYPTLLDVEAPSKGDPSYARIGKNATLLYVVNSENFWCVPRTQKKSTRARPPQLTQTHARQPTRTPPRVWGRQIMGYNVTFNA